MESPETLINQDFCRQRKLTLCSLIIIDVNPMLILSYWKMHSSFDKSFHEKLEALKGKITYNKTQSQENNVNFVLFLLVIDK
jgi:hypothetical protein